VPLLSYKSKIAGRLLDRYANDSQAAPWRDFLPNFIISQVSGACYIQTAKPQQFMCHYCPTREKHLGDLWIAAPTFPTRFFSKFCCSGEVSGTWKSQQCTCRYCASPAKKMGDLLSISKLAVRETAKRPQFNNERAVIVLAEQNSWTTCGPLRQRFWRLSMWIFWQILLPWWGERYVKNPKFNNADAIIFPSWRKWCVKQSWTLNTSDLQRRLADTMDKHYHKTPSTKLLIKTLVSTSGN